jgi:hypothetical protein
MKWKIELPPCPRALTGADGLLAVSDALCLDLNTYSAVPITRETEQWDGYGVR